MSQGVITMKAGMVPLTTLTFDSSDIDAIRSVLSQRQAEAPALFRNMPCVLDLTGLEAAMLTLESLVGLCREHGLLPVGVRNVSSDWADQVNKISLADFGKGSNKSNRGTATVEAAASVDTNTPATENAQTQPQAESTSEPVSSEPVSSEPKVSEQELPQRSVKVHSGNVRSGQQVYTDGDLVVLGMVSAGAEVLATGDVHIYGALRGRALAGVKGDLTAVIACQQFDAELVAVAGQYRLFEDDHPHRGQAVAVQLKDDNLNITSV
jgi:septum site-determining protein MinC